MGDSLITVVAIVLAAVLMFIFPLMSVSERNDDIAQLTVSTATEEFVNEVTTTGNLTKNDYDKFSNKINSTDDSFDVTIEVKRLDENPGKKGTWVEGTKIGENLYYSEYTSQIIKELDETGKITLKKGDMISVSVKNTNRTIAQMLRSFFYNSGSSDTYQIAASHSGVIMANGR